jgi:hypothetical protein
MMDLPDDGRGSVLYLGIDDFALRRGSRFGTILVDLESHRPIDVLPDRRAETAAAWMRNNPEIQVVSRDRGTQYASAASEASPSSDSMRRSVPHRQKPDRGDPAPLGTLSNRHRGDEYTGRTLSKRANETGDLHRRMASKGACPGARCVRLTRLAGRKARDAQVMEGLSQGVTTKEVACQLGLSERTVQKWKAAPTFPEVKKRRKKRSDFDAFARLSAQTRAARESEMV